MFGTSGVRGPVGETVTAELALHLGRVVGADTARIVVGRDVRDSGRAYADAVSAGAREAGADVVRVGVASTPTIARSVDWCDADVGVAVTASHNPATDNGLKLWTQSGRAFDDDEADAVARRIEAREFEFAPWDGFGTETTWATAAQRHVDTLTETFDAFDDLTTVVDLGNGAGRVTVDALYELGCHVETLGGQPDGRFPTRKSEPTAETLSSLCQTVAALDADVGLAHDGDADRLVAVTESGRFVAGDSLLALFAREAVTEGPGSTVAVPVDTSLLVADVVEAAGGDVVYTPVGDTYIAAQVAAPDFVFGGEPSGAWIWPEATLCPDGHYAACRLASLVARAGSFDALVDDFDGYATRRANVTVVDADKQEVMTRIETAVFDQFDRVDTIDGVRVDVDDGWFLVRPSGTEPLVRVTAEARTAATADALLSEAESLVTDAASA